MTLSIKVRLPKSGHRRGGGNET